METSRSNGTQDQKLLSSRLIPIHSAGWEVFTITQAVSNHFRTRRNAHIGLSASDAPVCCAKVRSWMSDDGSNLGLHMVVRTLGGSQVDQKLLRFASGRNHHQSKQPMLVLFTDDGRQSATLGSVGEAPARTKDARQSARQSLQVQGSLTYETIFTKKQLPSTDPHDTTDTSSLPMVALSSRSARSVDHSEEEGVSTPCQRLPLYVDFEEIGWSGWIVSPRGYNAYHCKGSCPFPLGQTMRPTNHATVQSIIHALKLIKGIEMPCCVPDKLFSINLLYFDDDENVVLKQYKDMVAGSCGCH